MSIGIDLFAYRLVHTPWTRVEVYPFLPVLIPSKNLFNSLSLGVAIRIRANWIRANNNGFVFNLLKLGRRVLNGLIMFHYFVFVLFVRFQISILFRDAVINFIIALKFSFSSYSLLSLVSLALNLSWQLLLFWLFLFDDLSNKLETLSGY